MLCYLLKYTCWNHFLLIIIIILKKFWVDLRCILFIDPLPLSQVVLLYLLRHLTYGINDNVPQNIVWMKDIVNAIIPIDPMIAMHVRPILNEVYGFLNHQQNLPTIIGDELSSIRRLMHVIYSKIM